MDFAQKYSKYKNKYLNLIQKGGMHKFSINEQFITQNGDTGIILSLLEKENWDTDYSYSVSINKGVWHAEIIQKVFEKDLIKLNTNIDEVINKININKNYTIISHNEYNITIKLDNMTNNLDKIHSKGEIYGKIIYISYEKRSFPNKMLELNWNEILKVTLSESKSSVIIENNGYNFIYMC